MVLKPKLLIVRELYLQKKPRHVVYSISTKITLMSSKQFHRPGNLASLGKQSIVTVFVHLAETMKQIFVSPTDTSGNDT